MPPLLPVLETDHFLCFNSKIKGAGNECYVLLSDVSQVSGQVARGYDSCRSASRQPVPTITRLSRASEKGIRLLVHLVTQSSYTALYKEALASEQDTDPPVLVLPVLNSWPCRCSQVRRVTSLLSDPLAQ